MTQEQKTLDGKGVTELEKPWHGICCKRCWYAKREKCKCKCQGKNHQKGIQKKTEEKPSPDIHTKEH